MIMLSNNHELFSTEKSARFYPMDQASTRKQSSEISMVFRSTESSTLHKGGFLLLTFSQQKGASVGTAFSQGIKFRCGVVMREGVRCRH